MRIVGAISFTVNTLLYMGVVLYGPSLALQPIVGLPLWISIVGLGLLCTFYTTLVSMATTIAAALSVCGSFCKQRMRKFGNVHYSTSMILDFGFCFSRGVTSAGPPSSLRANRSLKFALKCDQVGEIPWSSEHLSRFSGSRGVQVSKSP